MAPTYKLTYFNARGGAEPLRFLLKYGGIEFEDVRVQHEEWPKLKKQTPFGQLPVLEKNGKQIGQSLSICRYLGKVVKLAGNDDWENLEIDAIVDTVSDLSTKIYALHYESDEAKKKTLKENLLKETIPYYFSRFDAIVAKNKGYIALGKLTWADLVFATVIPGLDAFIGGESLQNYKNLTALIDKVNELPAIKKWIAERPKTEF